MGREVSPDLTPPVRLVHCSTKARAHGRLQDGPQIRPVICDTAAAVLRTTLQGLARSHDGGANNDNSHSIFLFGHARSEHGLTDRSPVRHSSSANRVVARVARRHLWPQHAIRRKPPPVGGPG